MYRVVPTDRPTTEMSEQCNLENIIMRLRLAQVAGSVMRLRLAQVAGSVMCP